ncbi:heparinase II/III family protein [Bartonella bovis]|uniref:heparinase II/III family protein n=1 Tax=Bartonella bovis TaxID=155194 RepID=UPI0003B54978|nr:heparinase II/III family protein [Bartonella bovis]
MTGEISVAIAVGSHQIKTSVFVYKVLQSLRRLWMGPLFRWRFLGFHPQRILAHPIDLHLADSKVAHEFYHGRFAFAGRVVQSCCLSPFTVVPPTPEWEAALHDFHWLRHMTVARNPLAIAHARSLLEDWLDHSGKKIKGLPWSGEVVARRLIVWICHSQILLDGASKQFEKRFLHSLGFQFRYLRISIRSMEENDQRLQAVIALVFASLALPVCASIKKKVQTYLIYELSHQILIDGGHISRNPAILLSLLLDLLSLRDLYKRSNETVPRILIDSVERMLPALRFFIHEDRTLAHFNGVGPIISEHLSAILDFDETGGNPFSYARYSGFQRLQANQTIVLADTGKFPPHCASQYACSGCLSFEMSSQGKRFIINAGIAPYGDEEYRHFGRITAAHSTATVNDCSVGIFRKRKSPNTSLLLEGPTNVKVQRIEGAEKIGFVACHDGYVRPFNLVHERGLTLTTNGATIEGFDRFFMPHTAQSNRRKTDFNEPSCVAVRFHLHPKVEVIHNGESVHLVVEGRRMWHFMSPDTDIYLEDSIDFAELEGPQSTQQIVLYLRPALTEKIHWRFVRLESE